MTKNIKLAVNDAQTYQELLPIARELRAELSSWGYQYAIVTAQSSLYEGTIAVGAVAERAMKIRKKMEKDGAKLSEAEKNNITSLCEEISRLYNQDKVNCDQADRVTTIYRFIVSILFWVNHQSKWNDRNDHSYEKQLQQPLSISLKTAVNKAQNFQGLLPIVNELHAGLSWWGYQYAYVPISTSIDKDVIYTGRIATGAVAKKALKIRQEMKKNKMGFTRDEANSVYPLCKKIYCLYVEDKSLCSQANRLTTIFRSVVRVIFWADHQSRWGAVWDYSNKVETYSEIICEDLPGSIEGNTIKGEWTRDCILKIREWESQGATYIPYPNET